jgi:hypothetical protein
VNLTEFAILASQAEFKVGLAYTFDVTNIGQFTHQFYIEKAGAVDEALEANGQELAIESMDAGPTTRWA